MSQINKVFKTFPPEQQGDFLIVLDDHGYNEVYMKFEAYECTMTDLYQNDIIVMPFAYPKIFGNTNFDVTDNFYQAEVFAKGYLDWQGCLSCEFPDNDYHCCGLEETRKFSRLFEKLYKIAPECIERWDGD